MITPDADLRRDILDHLVTYDVRPDMRRPLADVLEGCFDDYATEREKRAAQKAVALLFSRQIEKGYATLKDGVTLDEATKELADAVLTDLFLASSC